MLLETPQLVSEQLFLLLVMHIYFFEFQFQNVFVDAWLADGEELSFVFTVFCVARGDLLQILLQAVLHSFGVKVRRVIHQCALHSFVANVQSLCGDHNLQLTHIDRIHSPLGLKVVGLYFCHDLDNFLGLVHGGYSVIEP